MENNMIKGDIFKERVKETYAMTKDGKVSKKYVIRICDECGKEEKRLFATLRNGRKVRRGNIDLCKNCANSGKYRKLPKGINHGHYKHGLTNNGYKRITSPDGKRMLEHKFLMEQKIGRPLETNETIHHIDMDKINNNISNLYLFNDKKEHNICHSQMEKMGYELLGKYIWFDHKINEYALKYKRRFYRNPIKHNHKIYNKKDPRTGYRYEACNLKISNNNWSWKRSHVLLMEKFIGRKIYRNECIHHIDGNSLNNDINNLYLMTNSDHGCATRTLQKCIAQLCIKGIISFQNGKYYIDKKWKKK
jgi:hypothetical protein